jgi:hypothetical protein
MSNDNDELPVNDEGLVEMYYIEDQAEAMRLVDEALAKLFEEDARKRNLN